MSDPSRLSLGRGTGEHVSRCISVQPHNSGVLPAIATITHPAGLFSIVRAIDPRAAGYYLSEPMNAAVKANTIASIRNALAALIGHPSNLDGCLSRRLQG